MSQCAYEISGRRYILDLEPVEFYWEFTRGTKGERVLVLSWRRETQFKNIIAFTLVTIRLKPPFLTINSAILDRDEPVEDLEF